MRRILVASVLSSCALAAAAATPKPATDASTAAPLVISTGVTEARLLHPASVNIPFDATLDSAPNPAKVVLKVNVDEGGNPTHVQIVQSFSPEVDAHVVGAVRQLHWRPAVLDNQTIPVDLNLVVQVQH